MYTWEFDGTADIWRNGEFDTIEGCIKEAKECYNAKPSDIIYVGETKHWEPFINATYVLEQLETDAFEECGKIAEDWCAYNFVNWANAAEIDKLSEQLTEIVRQWLKDNNNYPNFYKIVNVEEIKIK